MVPQQFFHISINEYVVIALFHYPVASPDGTVGVACIDPQMGGNGNGVLVTLTSGVCRGFDDTGLLEIFGGSGFDTVASLVAYSWSSRIDWSWIEPPKRKSPYQLSSERALDVSKQP